MYSAIFEWSDRMDISKKLELTRRRNELLQEENESLKAQILQQGKDENRYAKLCTQLESLKKKWEKEVAEIKELKAKYELMISDVKKVKDVLIGK